MVSKIWVVWEPIAFSVRRQVFLATGKDEAPAFCNLGRFDRCRILENECDGARYVAASLIDNVSVGIPTGVLRLGGGVKS
jgi:hypothetical protein